MAGLQRVLIVEDETVLRHVLADKFGRQGFVVSEAKDGEEGLKIALNEHPDIILLDLIMPKLDGLSMVDQLQKDAWGKQVPVLVLTNLSDLHTVDLARARGLFNYFVKSDWSIDDLIKKTRTVLEQMQQEKESPSAK